MSRIKREAWDWLHRPPEHHQLRSFTSYDISTFSENKQDFLPLSYFLHFEIFVVLVIYFQTSLIVAGK